MERHMEVTFRDPQPGDDIPEKEKRYRVSRESKVLDLSSRIKLANFSRGPRPGDHPLENEYKVLQPYPRPKLEKYFRIPRPRDDPVQIELTQFEKSSKARSARDAQWLALPKSLQERDLKPYYYRPFKECTWEPPRPVSTVGHSYALTDEVRKKFPSSGLHLLPRATMKDLLVPEFTGYEDFREAEKWVTQFAEWTIMYGLSAALSKEVLVDYLHRALRPVPFHPITKKEYASWDDFLRDFFLDMKIKKVERFKEWYWEKKKFVPIIWFSHMELKVATNFFDSSLVCGESETARLIKANMPNMEVAVVKRWKKVMGNSLAKVLREIDVHRYLPRHHTPNIVHLLGYCTSREDPLLVYEFVPNGNLREHFKGKYGGDYIWRSAPLRLAIAIDVASGIGELHYNGKLPVYHRDLKPSNILLDYSYRARVSDFGDAVVIKSDDDRHRPKVCGSLGYLDPIYRQTGRCDDKTDVYNLGVILLELATGFKAWDPYRQHAHAMNPFLVGLVMEKVEKGEILEVVRPGKPYGVGSPVQTMEGTQICSEMIRVGLWCCCPDLHYRPRANEVVSALVQIQQRWVNPGFQALQQLMTEQGAEQLHDKDSRITNNLPLESTQGVQGKSVGPKSAKDSRRASAITSPPAFDPKKPLAAATATKIERKAAEAGGRSHGQGEPKTDPKIAAERGKPLPTPSDSKSPQKGKATESPAKK